ncbi:Ureidoglycolate hydrolase [Hirschfeldia incana]|nr:Ureidoglycolate hydrolase [Hirschfeldia incana]
MAESPVEVNLIPIEATPESFADYGQVIEASSDGDRFGPNDAQLDLSRGIPRFYIMRLEGRTLGFSTITHHANVTQCLGSIGGHVWYLGVAKPSLIADGERAGDNNVESGSGGHLYSPPTVEEVRVFKFSGPKFVKLNRGTWHAGPLFSESSMDFYNLELSNTNEVDHTTHSFKKKNGVIFRFEDSTSSS